MSEIRNLDRDVDEQRSRAFYEEHNIMAITGFVISIISLFFNNYTAVSILALVISIMGFVRGGERGVHGRGRAIAGAGIVIAVIATIATLYYYFTGGTIIRW
ncbi:MAG: hypothetical protein FWG10_04380 [Eubacteriaceae bacterium]|nr:hypothetical protein [Eubacteriaceae bacterium]